MEKKLQIKLIDNSRDYYESLIEKLGTAREKVSMVYYAYCDGTWSQKIDEVLLRKTKEGASVSLYVSRAGTLFEDYKLGIKNFPRYSYLRKFGIKIVVFPDVLTRPSLHVKVVAIDDKILYVGSSNVADHYLSWTDTNFEISGVSSIKKVHACIDCVLGMGAGCNCRFSLDAQTRFFIQNPEIRNDFEKELVRLIKESKRFLKIVTWYFWPSKKILDEIVKAGHRGVDICIMYSLNNRVPLLHPFRYLSSKYLVSRGVDFYQWDKGYNHSKLYWNESRYLVGSPNLEHYSLERSYEVFVRGSQKYMLSSLNQRFESWKIFCRRFG